MRFLTAANILGAIGQAIDSDWIVEIDANGDRTGNIFWSGGAGATPSKSATVADVSQIAAAGSVIPDWLPVTPYNANDVVRATVAVTTLGIEAGDIIRRISAGTSGATLNAAEGAAWEELGAQIVKSVAGKSGTVSLVVADVTGLETDLDAKQATLVSGTNIKTVGGASLVGSGNVNIAADLPGGTSTTILDEGLNAGNATVDRTTVPGETILRYATTGAASTFVAPLGVTAVRTLLVGGGGGGGGGEGVVAGDGGGGGGAGEFSDFTAIAVTPGSALNVTVGAGGAGANSFGGVTGTNGTNGSDSTFDTLTARGGGGGGGNDLPANSGGSGGGGGGRCSSGVDLVGGAATAVNPGLGFPGGAGTGVCTNRDGAGGGGAGAAGGSSSGLGTSGFGGTGGAGVANNITGAPVTYAGGGGGGVGSGQGTVGTGGAGGGGAGGASNGAGVVGAVNTGGGGGGGGARAGEGLASGAAGGSGVVIIRFPTQSRTFQTLQSFANDAAAVSGGLLIGQFYNNSTTGGISQII